MAVSNRALYLYTINDVPGSAVPWVFLSVFNPVGSGVVHIATSAVVASYATGGTSVAGSMLSWRTTSHLGGTLISNSVVARHQTDWPNPVSQIRIGGPVTVPATGVGAVVSAFPPVISSGQGVSNSISATPQGATFVVAPGQGFAFGTVVGDADQVWNITYIWQEIS